jgi:phage terminase large subunit-like protein
VTKSTAEQIAELPPEERKRFLSLLSPDAQALLKFDWSFWARPEQIAPLGDWRTWLILAGRGFGKTRSGAEWVRDELESGKHMQAGVIGATKESTRKIQVEGPSGILEVCPPHFRPIYEPSNTRLVFPNGAICHLYTAEEPEKLRGPNLGIFWADEICAWGTPQQAKSVYDMMSLCLRITGPKGDSPREVITTTPKPMPLLREIMKSPGTIITSGSIFDNAASLDAATLKFYVEKFKGTRLARQELYGEVLDAFEGALWTPEMLDRNRRVAPDFKIIRAENSGAACLLDTSNGQRLYFKRIVVAIDPAGTANRKSNQTGIVVAALGEDEDGYILQDLSGIYSPETWARKAIDAYHDWGADRVLAEQNYGGDMVASTLRAVDRSVPVKLLVASRGKRVRAEPVAALDEQNRIHHVGQFPKMEDQMVTWDPMGTGDSPDVMDARVWAITDLMLKRKSLFDTQPSAARGPIAIYAR